MDHNGSDYFKCAAFQIPAFGDQLILIVIVSLLDVITAGNNILILQRRFQYETL
jgi:hypothetical protein